MDIVRGGRAVVDAQKIESLETKKSNRVAVRLVHWDNVAALHLGEYLQKNELDSLFSEWYLNRVALWGVFNGSIRVGTLASRIDEMYNNQRHFVLNHCGGGWLHHMDTLSPFFDRIAREYNCHFIRIDAARKSLADVMAEKWGFTPYEYSVTRGVK